jgi:hypothetical protein
MVLQVCTFSLLDEEWTHCDDTEHTINCAGYKAYSHHKALKGCRKLLASVYSSSGVSPHSAGSPASEPAASSASAPDASTQHPAGSRPDADGEGPNTAGNASGNKQELALVQMMSDEELAELVQSHHRYCILHCTCMSSVIMCIVGKSERRRTLMYAGADCRASQEPAVDEESAKVIGQRFGFEGLPKLLSRMLKGLQKQT